LSLIKKDFECNAFEKYTSGKNTGNGKGGVVLSKNEYLQIVKIKQNGN
jgi:hypothetical protein